MLFLFGVNGDYVDGVYVPSEDSAYVQDYTETRDECTNTDWGHWQCNNGPTGRDPVCLQEADGVDRTFWNSCMAMCLSENGFNAGYDAKIRPGECSPINWYTMEEAMGVSNTEDSDSEVAMSTFKNIPMWVYGTFTLVGLNAIVILSVKCSKNNVKTGSEALLEQQ